VAVGATFQVPVVLNGAADVSSAALQIHYDAAKMSLLNVTVGDLLSRNGQSAQSAHRDDPPGNLRLGIARPSGSPGVTGSGVVCVLTFQAKAAGASDLTVTGAGLVTTAQVQIPVAGTSASIVIK
jgi:general secretion pathway protein D